MTQTFVHEHQGELVLLKAGKDSLQVTPNHPVWVEGKGWTPAGELTAGEKVVLADGERVRLEEVETTLIRGPPILVYNLEVEGTHTYFVGRAGVWVHNCNVIPPSRQLTTSVVPPSRQLTGPQTEIVQRAMSRAELEATQSTGLLRGGRGGTHYVSDAVNSDPLRAQQRMALPQTPEVRVTMEVPSGVFSPPTKIEPKYSMPGGGMERMATGNVPVQVIRVDPYK